MAAKKKKDDGTAPDVPVLDLGVFGKVAAGTNVGEKGIQDGSLPNGWVVAGGILYAPTQTKELIAAEYGWAAAFLDHKELGPLLREAAKNGWTMQKLEAELKQTDWWANKSSSEREYLRMGAEEPETLRGLVADKVDELQGIASSIGGQLSAEQLDDLANRSLKQGWTELEVSSAVTLELLRNGNRQDVRSGVLGRSMRETADAMAIPVSRQTLDSWIRKIAKGKVTMEDYNTWVRNQAKGLYSALADDINKGLTVRDLADPYAQIAARVLGVTAEQIDFTKAKWNTALNFVDGSGKRRTMTLAEWEDTLRQDDRYGYTKTEEATNKAYVLADALSKMFGKVG